MPDDAMPVLSGVLETSLYVDDVDRSLAFYGQTLGFEPMFHDPRFAALDICGRQVLLLFKKGATSEPIHLPGGIIPPHDGQGTTHVAFATAANELTRWEAWLPAKGVEIESRVTWPRGGVSLYFRDPDGHLVELVTPGIWPIY